MRPLPPTCGSSFPHTHTHTHTHPRVEAGDLSVKNRRITRFSVLVTDALPADAFETGPQSRAALRVELLHPGHTPEQVRSKVRMPGVVLAA